MRISDWSSDVCSSDLPDRPLPVPVDRKDDADARRRLSPRLAAAPGQRADRLTPGKTAATSARRRTGTAVRASEAYRPTRSEEHTSELQSLMRITYAVFCLKKKINNDITDIA